MTLQETNPPDGSGRRRASTLGPQAGGRREAIVRAAIQLFVENGGEPTSLEMVAAAAGVTRTAVYYYFPSKSDLLQEVLRRLDWDWWLSAIKQSEEDRFLSGRLRILLRTLLTQSSENEESVYFALVKASRDDSDVRRGCDDVRELDARELDDLVDGVLGLVWCMASGIANTKNRSVINQMMKAIDLVCPEPPDRFRNLFGGGPPRSPQTNSGRL
jgi:AcrR family transcriptional regulator